MNASASQSVLCEGFLARWHPFAWIALTVLCLYGRTVTYGFSYLDDFHLVERNARFLSDLSNIPRAFTENVFEVQNRSRAYYRPLLFVSFMLDARVFGTHPAGYHLHNVLLHVGVSWLVFALLRRLALTPAAALMFATLYAAHPVLTRVVAWIPGRCDLLLAGFVLISLLSYLQFRRTRGKAAYAGHLLGLACAYFTKETAVLLIPLYVLTAALVTEAAPPEAVSRGTRFRLALIRKHALWLEWALITLFWLAMRTLVLEQASAQLAPAMFVRSVARALPGLLQLYGKTLLPFNLSVLPLQQDTACAYGAAALALTAAALLATGTRRRDVAAWGAAWFVLFLLPVFFRPADARAADLNLMEHRLNLPLIGLAVLWAESGAIRGLSRRPVAGTAVWLCVLGAFAAATIVYAADFRDPLTFWQSGVRTSPHSAFAHKNLGVIRYLHGDPSGAERHYRRALKLRPGEPMVRNNLGLLCLEQGRLAEAEALFREELELYPRYEKPYFNLARLYDRQGNAAAAEHWRARAARIARGE